MLNSNLIIKEFTRISTAKETKSILLTGGHSVIPVYREWRRSPEFLGYKRAKFYFSDERCVSRNDKESNFFMARSIFSNFLDNNQLVPMWADKKKPRNEALRYSSLLPDILDLAILSVGEDGHIASLFPYNDALKSKKPVVYVSNSPKPPSHRLTVTKSVIKNAKNVIVKTNRKIKFNLLYDQSRSLQKKIKIEQLRRETN